MVIRRGDCANIREPCRKGHSICAPPTGVALMGAAQTHLIMLSAPSLGVRGREDGSSGEDAICGNCADAPLCFDTILPAGFRCADGLNMTGWNKRDDTESTIIRHKRTRPYSAFHYVATSQSFISSMTLINIRRSRLPLSHFLPYLFAQRLTEGNSLEALSIFSIATS